VHGDVMELTMDKPRKPAGTLLLADQSYLAYVRQVPRPFRHFTSGHFPAGTVTQPHSHPCLALHGCLQGPVTLLTQAGDHTLEAGAFCLLAAGVGHHWVNAQRQTAATFSVLLETEHAGRWPASSGVAECCQELQRRVRGAIGFQSAGDRELHHTFWQAADHLTAEQARDPLALVGALLSLLGLVRGRLGRDRPTSPARTELAQQIRRLLLARVNDRLGIKAIARELEASPTLLKQAFRAAFGCGIMSYFNQLKIWKAKRLLGDPGLTVEQVSAQLGFANAAYFSRVFSQQAGESPTLFRRHAAADGRAAQCTKGQEDAGHHFRSKPRLSNRASAKITSSQAARPV
jgi:AraC-like DNA-binding protein